MQPTNYQGHPRWLILFGIFLLMITGVLWWSISLVPKRLTNKSNTSVACTEEAKICPDGSTVGRVGPNCEFSICPDVQANVNESVICTQDVKTCPDGSTVSRQALTCQFGACPVVQKNTNQSNPAISVTMVVSNAELLNGQLLCIQGMYQNSFEFSAFGTSSRVDTDTNTQLVAPYVWVGVDVSSSSLTCLPTQGQQSCQGTVTVCGVFHYAAPGVTGLGQTGAYRYSLEAS